MSQAPTAVDILYQDIQTLERRLADLTSQVQRVQRLVHIDEREAAVADKNSQAELYRAVAKNTDLVAELLKRQRAADADPLDMRFFHMERQRRSREVRASLERIRHLKQCKQEITPCCPCGQHKGIRFVDNAGNSVAEVCPKSWWISQSRLAFEENRLGQFIKSTPLEKYIKPFVLGK